MNRFFVGSGGQRYLFEEKIGSGGQGNVYGVKNLEDGRKYAVKWYHRSVATPDQRQRLEALIASGAPMSGVDGISFIWPIELVTLKEEPGFGYVMPLIDTHAFCSLNKIANGKRKQPDMKHLCRLSYLLCMALESVHRNGMAYCDINLGNVMFDPDNAKVLVCDNDNVVVNNADVPILGVPEFMAPEVALGQSLPNAQSDLYSIAILLYQLWMWEHPMDGLQTLEKVNCWDIPSKRKWYASAPVFVHHPKDLRNTANGVEDLALSLKRWELLCPSVLKEAFTHSFVEAVHHPEKRLRLSEWQKIFLELEANCVSCVSCSASNVVDIRVPGHSCFACGTPLPVFLVLQIHQGGTGRSNVAVYTGAVLRRFHLAVCGMGSEAMEVAGQIVPHPEKQNVHGLRNESKETWVYEHGGGKYPVQPGEARPLLPGGEMVAGSARMKIVYLPGKGP